MAARRAPIGRGWGQGAGDLRSGLCVSVYPWYRAQCCDKVKNNRCRLEVRVLSAWTTACSCIVQRPSAERRYQGRDAVHSDVGTPDMLCFASP